MALNDTQKAQIRLYLGYPDHFRYKHTRLESILDNLSPEAEAQVIDCLTSLVTVEAKVLGTSLSSAGIKRVDEVWFFDPLASLSVTRNIGKQYVTRISIITGVPIYSNVFGSAGYLGDSFSGSGGGRPGSGGGFYGLG